MDKIDKEQVSLLRCIITSEKEPYYKGKDYQGNKYLIEKNKDFKKSICR